MATQIFNLLVFDKTLILTAACTVIYLNLSQDYDSGRTIW